MLYRSRVAGDTPFYGSDMEYLPVVVVVVVVVVYSLRKVGDCQKT